MTVKLYGLYAIGYTRVTKVMTKSYAYVNISKSLKVTSVQIIFWKRKYEGGIVSNRKS